MATAMKKPMKKAMPFAKGKAPFGKAASGKPVGGLAVAVKPGKIAFAKASKKA